MDEQKHIMVIAGEPSGDLHGANLVKELINKNKTHRNQNSLIITGIGGDLMANEGVNLFFHIKDLSAMGITEVIKQFKHISKAFYLFRKRVIAEKSYKFGGEITLENTIRQSQSTINKPDLLILIDYPGFNLKAAAFAKRYNIPVLYYITPKVWAWNSSRLKKIKQFVDHAALIFPFEKEIFDKAKIPATYVGNPLLDYYDEPSFYDKSIHQIYEQKKHSSSKDYGFKKHGLTIGFLPGSRESEITKLLETMLQSAIIINSKVNSAANNIENIRFILSAASSVNINKFNKILKPYNKDNMFEVVQGNLSQIFKECDILIVASGTVTLEAAICGVPMVIIYKTSPITYFLAKRVVKIPYIGLPNIVAKYPIVPELLQNEANPEKIANQVLSLINQDKLRTMRKQLIMMTRCLGDSGTSKRTAKLAFQMLERQCG